MNKSEYKKLRTDFFAKTFIQQEQFGQWLRKLFYLNRELAKEYDTIYQDSFYIVFYEMVTVGLSYSKKVYENVKGSSNKEKEEFYKTLIDSLEEFKATFSDTELQFIEYKRHSAAHIFQNHYEKRFSEKGKLIDERKGKSIENIHKELDNELLDKGFDIGFDDYMIHRLNSKINNLYDQLQKIKAHHNNSRE